MDEAGGRRLVEAVQQARARAMEAAAEIERDPDASRAVETAVRDAQEALTRLAKELEGHD